MIDLDAARNGDVDILDLIAEVERLRTALGAATVEATEKTVLQGEIVKRSYRNDDLSALVRDLFAALNEPKHDCYMAWDPRRPAQHKDCTVPELQARAAALGVTL